LRTSWVEPAYLETDASWCLPGGEPASPLANGGAFGAKAASLVTAAARDLADRHGHPVRVVLSREDVVRLGPKRPPLAGGIDDAGHGVMRVARTPGVTAAITAAAPGLVVEEVDVAGPPTSAAIRGAGWVEANALLAAARGLRPVRVPGGGVAEAEVTDAGITVRVGAGEVLDAPVLRSYCIGAAHMGWSLVTSESLAVSAAGEVEDLTVRSFGVARAVDMPPVTVEIDVTPGPAVNGSDAVFAAVAAATWVHRGCPPQWPAR
jgi:CO/xanthine dehydrogenase Mo-binding subunit